MDRALTHITGQVRTLTQQLTEVLSYTRQLESALLSTPMIRTGGYTDPEHTYEQSKQQWFRTFGAVLERASYTPENERRRQEVKVRSRIKVVRNQLDTIVQRRQYGDDVPLPTANELLSMLEKELRKP